MAIVIHIDAVHAAEFEAMFEAEEIPIWDEYTAKGMFKECSLTRVTAAAMSRMVCRPTCSTS